MFPSIQDLSATWDSVTITMVMINEACDRIREKVVESVDYESKEER